MTKLCHGPTIQSVGRLGFDQFPLWRWGTVQPSSSMKHSFSPARSSVAEGTCPRTHTSRSWSRTRRNLQPWNRRTSKSLATERLRAFLVGGIRDDSSRRLSSAVPHRTDTRDTFGCRNRSRRHHLLWRNRFERRRLHPCIFRNPTFIVLKHEAVWRIAEHDITRRALP
jgi:hypothetical protein